MAQGVTIDFNANIARFTSAIDKATNDLNKFQSNSARISQNINKAFGALGIGLSAAGIGAFIKSSIDAADNINDLSQKIGVSVENLAGYKLAAEQSGTSLEGMGLAAQKLNQSLAKNDPLLKKLGVTATDANGALVQLADVFGSIPDGAQKTAIAMRLMGKSGADMIPLLNGGSAALQDMLDQGKKLYPVTSEMARAADQFNDSMAAFKVQAEGAGISIANSLLPAMNDMLARWNDAVTLSRQHGGFVSLIVGGINPTGDNSANLANVRKEIDAIQLQMKDAGTAQGAVAGIDGPRLKARLEELGRIKSSLLEIQRTQALALGAPFADYKQAKTPRQSLPSDLFKTGASGKAKTDKLDTIDPFGKERAAAELAQIKLISDAEAERFNTAMEIEDQRVASETREKSAMEDLRKQYIDIIDPIQKYRDKLDEVDKLAEAGLLNADQATSARLYWQDQMDGAAGFGEAMKKTASESEIFFETMAKNVQSSLADFLFDPFSDGLDGLAKGFGDMLKRMAAEAIAADIASAIFGKQSGAGKSGGGMLAGLLGGGSDQNLLGSFASLFGFANGGSFRVGGSGGTDSQLVAFKASPDERVTIQTPAQQRNNGGSQIINMTVVTQDAASFQKSRGQIQADLAMAVAGARRFS